MVKFTNFKNKIALFLIIIILISNFVIGQTTYTPANPGHSINQLDCGKDASGKPDKKCDANNNGIIDSAESADLALGLLYMPPGTGSDVTLKLKLTDKNRLSPSTAVSDIYLTALSGAGGAAEHVKVGYADVAGSIASSSVAGWTRDASGIVRLTTDTDKVGIGIVTPSAKLDVAGNAIIGGGAPTNPLSYSLAFNKYSTLWGADNNEYYLGHNVYYSNGWKYRESDMGTGATLINIGGGTFNVRTARDGVKDEAITWNQGIYQDSNGNVGIGTGSPNSRLHVASGINMNGVGKISVATGDGRTIGVDLNVNSIHPGDSITATRINEKRLVTTVSTNSFLTIDNPFTQSFNIGGEDFTIQQPTAIIGNAIVNSFGNVGIGTVIPSEKLEVVGKIKTQGFQLGTTADPGDILTADASGVGSWQPPQTSSLGNSIESSEITDGTIVNVDISPNAAIVGTKISPNFGNQNVITTGIINSGGLVSSGDVGIGTPSPGGALHVDKSTDTGLSYAIKAEKGDNNGANQYTVAGFWGGNSGNYQTFGALGAVTGGTKAGVYGINREPTGYAGYFSGDVYASGNINTNSLCLGGAANCITSWDQVSGITTETDPIASSALTAHKTSGDHDFRYYTKTESDANYQPLGSYLTTESDTLQDVTNRGYSTDKSITVGGLTVNGPDFILGANDGRGIGINVGQRALVHDNNDALVINFNEGVLPQDADFEGGIQFGSPIYGAGASWVDVGEDLAVYGKAVIENNLGVAGYSADDVVGVHTWDLKAEGGVYVGNTVFIQNTGNANFAGTVTALKFDGDVDWVDVQGKPTPSIRCETDPNGQQANSGVSGNEQCIAQGYQACVNEYTTNVNYNCADKPSGGASIRCCKMIY